jgi:D-glucuronyl C5-epimerase C-terminus
MKIFALLAALAALAIGAGVSTGHLLAPQGAVTPPSTASATATTSAHAAGALPTVTTSIVPELGIPAEIHRPNDARIASYSPRWAGLRLRYEGDVFRPRNPPMVYVPLHDNGRVLLPWQTSEKGKPGLLGLFPGNVLTVIDDRLYDLGVGTLMVKVRAEDRASAGYVPLALVLGNMIAADESLWSANDLDRVLRKIAFDFKGTRIYAIDQAQSGNIEELIRTFENPASYATALSGGQSGIHPVYAGGALASALYYALRGDTPPQLRDRVVSAARVFFDEYVFKAAVEQGDGAISWPYPFDWTTNWGVALKPPWFSAYANAAFSSAAAAMNRLTGEERYRALAEKAARYIGLPVERGGAEYDVSGFKLPAEYVYSFRETPNIRVLDGELITTVLLYNAARLLGDWDMLWVAARHAMSLAMQLEYFRNADGSLMFAAYVEKMPAHYVWTIWANLQALANISKDRRFKAAAEALRPHIGAGHCKDFGC